MIGVKRDHTLVRYGKIVGIEPTENRAYEQVVWRWKCDCGNVFESVPGNFVKRGKGQCPECNNTERRQQLSSRKTHGKTKTKEYRCWARLKQRCGNENHKDFPNYGGVGILLEESWSCSFEQFLEDVGVCPTDRDDYSLDRVDNTKGYVKGNVRWASPMQQSHNKSLQKNNTSGMTGVIPIKSKSVQIAWAAHWRDEVGKLHQKSFSIKKLGNDLAFISACEFRERMIAYMNEILGTNGYSEGHGKRKTVNV